MGATCSRATVSEPTKVPPLSQSRYAPSNDAGKKDEAAVIVVSARQQLKADIRQAEAATSPSEAAKSFAGEPSARKSFISQADPLQQPASKQYHGRTASFEAWKPVVQIEVPTTAPSPVQANADPCNVDKRLRASTRTLPTANTDGTDPRRRSVTSSPAQADVITPSPATRTHDSGHCSSIGSISIPAAADIDELYPPLVRVENIEDRYIFAASHLGAGSFGEVFQAWRRVPRHRGESEEQYIERCKSYPSVAIKKMKPTNPKVQEALKNFAAAGMGVMKAHRRFLTHTRKSVIATQADAATATKHNRRMSAPGAPAGYAAEAEAAAMKGHDEEFAGIGVADSMLVKDRVNMHKEAELLKLVQGSDYVVKIVDHCDDGICVYLVLEFCPGGDLMKYVMKCHHFSERVASYLFKQMLLSVAHCHSKGVVHRDLKPEQFLFLSDVGKAHLKLTDFGLATHVENANSLMTDAVGSAYFIAPEVFRRSYTMACDAWSLGVNLYLLLSGTVPFGAKAATARDVHRAIRNDPLEFRSTAWTRISAPARELVAGLLEKIPYKRYTIQQALDHPWVNGDAPDEPIDREVLAAMYKFGAQNRLRREALRIVSSTLTAADIRKLRTAFYSIDTDADQTISVTELAAALNSLGLTAVGHAVEEVMHAMDTDGDGKINIEEFLAATTELHILRYQQEIWTAFNAVDRDGDGHIDVEEAREILGMEAEDTIRQYIAEWDRDNDGRINYEEFIRMLIPKDVKFSVLKFT